jgi:hypothetical protein
MKNIKINFGLFVVVMALAYLLTAGCTKANKSSPYFSLGLINEAVLYRVDENDFYPEVYSDIVNNRSGIVDSIILDNDQWTKLIKIASMKESNSLEAIDCFQPEFIVMFYGGYHTWVSGYTVSFSCEQFKFADNSGIHVFSESQYSALQKWYSLL